MDSGEISQRGRGRTALSCCQGWQISSGSRGSLQAGPNEWLIDPGEGEQQCLSRCLDGPGRIKTNRFVPITFPQLTLNSPKLSAYLQHMPGRPNICCHTGWIRRPPPPHFPPLFRYRYVPTEYRSNAIYIVFNDDILVLMSLWQKPGKLISIVLAKWGDDGLLGL